MFIEEFDISLIRIKQTNEAGEVVYIPCDKTMLSETDYKKLSTVGTHTITVIYKLLEEQVTITLKRNESLTFERDLKVYFINVGQSDSIFIMLFPICSRSLLISPSLLYIIIFSGFNLLDSIFSSVFFVTFDTIK